MHSPCHEDHLLVRRDFVDVVRDGQDVACVALDCLAKFLNFESVLHWT